MPSTKDICTFFTPKEVSEMLKVSPRSVERACRLGEIKAVKVLSMWRIPQSAIDELMSVSR